ncbi:MAG: arsenosugar biosynthesis radical SAM protein ArsS [Sandaracinaceae bacterium]|nr:arsenosugar biosynthesis radical SAM protein ArsS [Sandaracinaceae bacterium]
MSTAQSAARLLPLFDSHPSFDRALEQHGAPSLVRGRVRTLQVNVGKLCNMACHHCHVEAGPKRTEVMSREVADRLLDLLVKNPEVEVVDFTGGAPELNPNFRRLVEATRRLGRRVIDRCNLTVLFEPSLQGLPEFLAAHEVEIVASLPCYSAENVEKQRGRGAFDKSIEGLLLLNRLGYGRPGSPLKLNLVYNPVGASLPPAQAKLEAKYKEELSRHFGIEFHDLLTITNMPIKRFAHALERANNLEGYMSLLVNHFNVGTVPELMCRSLVSVSWDGELYDCDFNQMLEIPLGAGNRTIWDVESFAELEQARVATASHCFGCTAGAGSSCSGALR